MSMKNKIATVFGGTGFVGRQIVRELAARGVAVKVATRVPERAYFLKLDGSVGQIVPVACDYNDEQSVAKAVKNSDYVVNCIGVLFERKRGDFKRAHKDIPAIIAKACEEEGVQRFVHISIPNIENDASRYASTKYEGEKAVQKAFPKVSILRPSVVFGPDDDFFNKFAELMRFFPVLPLIGGGKTKFQPVYVGDVADAVIAALEKPEAQGQIYELGGPDIVSFKEIYEILSRYTGRKRSYISLPFWLAKVQAVFMGLMPKPLLTCDQVESLKTDYLIKPSAQGLSDLGVKITGMDTILPTYLESYRSGGRFAALHGH
ncbi:MAG TPA: complex I NDUFA9 subunit family protein [Alphaproteobacteria bacterium]|nr:MAG: complex I NDUFA9 subunit family protein [Rhodospirillales bacterium]HOO81935.1 complex I NDUFA9 subunit family protein [Alphaproteobacteria bacterium]